LLDAVEAGDLPPSDLYSADDMPRWKERWIPSVVRAQVKTHHVEMLGRMAELMVLVRMPEADRLTPVKVFLQRTSRQPGIITPFWALITLDDAVCRSDAYLRCTAAAVASERYRRRHLRWPDALDALVPAFLSTVPLDPFDGAPLRYRKTGDGLVIYSVSTDGVDNAGSIDHDNPKATGKDVGIRLWDPSHRRQPPAKRVLRPP
jgi:hypothetical protein